MGGSLPIRARSVFSSLSRQGAAERIGRLMGRGPDYRELYGLLGQAGRNVERSTAVLRELMRSWPDGAEKRHDLVDLEHENDAVTHDIVHHLHARLAVPFERSDVLALASGLEDEGDRILREGLTALFEGGVDPMVVIRWKDIFERVEEGIDACDSVAHTLRGIAVKRA